MEIMPPGAMRRKNTASLHIAKMFVAAQLLRWDRRVAESFWQISLLKNGQKIWGFSNLQFVLR